MNESRKEILNRLANGEITSEEAEKLLESALPLTAQAEKIVNKVTHGVKQGFHTLSQAVVMHHTSDESKVSDTIVFPEEWNTEELKPVVQTHAKNAALTAATSGLLPGAGPTVAALTSAGFVLSMIHKINLALSLKLPKSEIKPVVDAIVHTITSMAKYLAASGLSFIPLAGNVAAGAIMASVCRSIVYTSGIVYLQALKKLAEAGAETITSDELRKTAEAVIQNQDIAQVFEEADRYCTKDEEFSKEADENPTSRKENI